MWSGILTIIALLILMLIVLLIREMNVVASVSEDSKSKP